MERLFILKGLTCPNCASKIEAEIRELQGVKAATLNLVRQTLSLSLLSPAAEDAHFVETIQNIVHSHEPDVLVFEPDSGRSTQTRDHAHAHDHACCSGHAHAEGHDCDHADGDGSSWTLPRLVVGGILTAALIACHFLGMNDAPWMLPAFIVVYLLLGYDVLYRAIRGLVRGRVLDENFLMAVASAGAFGIQEYPEAIAVMFLYQLGEWLQNRAVQKSRSSIASLLDIQPDTARVQRDGAWMDVAAADVAVGDRILVRPGERVPLDGRAVEGESRLDMRALTGESLPQSVHCGDEVYSGSVNLEGAMTLEVLRPLRESAASRIIAMVEDAAAHKAPAERFITRFARYYTPIVVAVAALLALVPPLLFAAPWAEWLRRAFVFLVISCPCALVISIPLTYFSGIGAASRRGILCKGSDSLDALHRVRSVVFDKTGTLTHGVFEIAQVVPAQDVRESDLLAVAAAAESQSNHPIARSIVNAVPNPETPDEYREIAGRGVSARIDGRSVLAGNAALMDESGIAHEAPTHSGTAVHVAREGRYLGHIVISDRIRHNAKSTVDALRETYGHRIAMLTGDAEPIARETARELGIDDFRAGLMPADKLRYFEQDDGRGGRAFVGDGINDAPVLARADVGIAMGALGSDAAIEAADVVLMADDISLVPESMRIAHKTHRIAVENIAFALAVKAILLTLGALGIIGMWTAVFGDVGVMMLAVLNAMRMLREAR